MMKVLVCFAVLIVVCVAQAPTPCETPKQWTSRRVRGDRYREYFEMALHLYDEINMRTYSKEEIDVGKERDYFLKLHLYREGLNYTMNLKTKTCEVTRISHPFRRVAVPLDAKFLFEAEIGAAGIPAEHLTAATFTGKFEDGAEYYVTVAEPDCIPITFDVRSHDVPSEHYEERYFDFHTGISSPELFIPPPECMTVPVPSV